MKNFIFTWFLQFIIFVAVYAAPIKVILDTDMDSDIDDVASMALLHHFADLGEVEILATISCSSVATSIQVVNAVNKFYNRQEIPVAAPNAGAPHHSWILRGDILASEYPNSATVNNSPSATELYRKTLAAQPDSSVVIITIGYLYNLRDLLLSGPDQYSTLTGSQLVAQKVSRYFCMGGRYPADDMSAEIKSGNFRPDPVSVSYVAENWPTPIVFTGGGFFSRLFETGNTLKTLPENNIVRRAYELAKGDPSNDWSHHTADILAVWLAVRGTEPWFLLTTYGYNEIDPYGRNNWQTHRDEPRHSYISHLKEGVDPAEVKQMFDNLYSNF
jgi:inosine-uridine nucleoside N-ribohydrolase